MRRFTIRVDGLPVWRADAEDTCDEDVLETGNEEQCRVLVVERLELVTDYVGLSIGIPAMYQDHRIRLNNRSSPRLSADPNEDKDLHRRVDNNLADDARQNLL